MEKSYKRPLSISFLAATDILLVNLGVVIAYWLRFGFVPPLQNVSPYLALIPWFSLASLISFFVFDLYTDWRRKSIYNLIYSIVLAILVLALSTMAITFWEREFAFPRSVILVAPLIQTLLVLAFRSAIWVVDRRIFGRKKVLIIGKDFNDGLTLAEKFLQHNEGWFVVEDFLQVNERKSLEIKLNNIDVVLLSPHVEDKAEIVSYCTKLGKEVLVVPQIFELFLLDSQPQQIDDMLVLSIRPPKLSSSQLLVKRTFDIITSFSMLIVLSPIMFLLYILIPLISPGQALYKQERLAQGGVPYYIYKFRSMILDAEKKTGPVLTTDKDPRVTQIGRFIRATRLDELPQLINVLKGDMSLVGPRPERAFFIDQFKEVIPGYEYRLSVKPGITGLAQVMGKYGTTVEDKLRFDLLYVRNYSFALDIRTLFQTIRVVLQRQQATGVQVKDQQRKEKLMRLFGNSEIASTKDEILYLSEYIELNNVPRRA